LARQTEEIGSSLCIMVARSSVVFKASMAAILANPVEICFGSFTTTSLVSAAATSSAVAERVAAAPAATTVSDLATKMYLEKPAVPAATASSATPDNICV
jgi:hypothetical protein